MDWAGKRAIATAHPERDSGYLGWPLKCKHSPPGLPEAKQKLSRASAGLEV